MYEKMQISSMIHMRSSHYPRFKSGGEYYTNFISCCQYVDFIFMPHVKCKKIDTHLTIHIGGSAIFVFAYHTETCEQNESFVCYMYSIW